MLLQIGDGLVRGIGFGLQHLFAAQVVEMQYQCGIPVPGPGRGHVLDAVFFPQTIAVAEGPYAAFGAHAGTGEEDDVHAVAKVVTLHGLCRRPQATSRRLTRANAGGSATTELAACGLWPEATKCPHEWIAI